MSTIQSDAEASGPASPPPAASAGSAAATGRNRWMVLAAVAVAQLMVVLDTTIVNIALPSAQADLGFADASRQWIVTGYALAFGSLLLLGGRLGDIVGRRTVFLVGLAGFAVASAVGGLAPSVTLLLVARVLQGVFGALLAPAALSLLTTTFGEGPERRRALGIFGSLAGVGGAVGLVLGGTLTEYLDWRWCMFVNLVFAAFSLVVGARTLPRRNPDTGSRRSLDLPGTALVTAGLFCVVFGLSQAETSGWTSGTVLGLLAVGAVLLGGFLVRQARTDHPLLPLRVLRDRNRAGAYLTILVVGMGLFSVNLFLVYYLQRSLGFSALVSGLAFLPMAGTILLSSNLGSAFVLPRIGPRWSITLGLSATATGLAWLSQVDPGGSYATGVLGPIIVLGAGLGLTISSAINAATTGVLPEDSGVASAMVTTSQQVGGSVGTAVFSALAASSTAAALGVAPGAVDAAQVAGYSTAFGGGAVVAMAGAVMAFLLVRTPVAGPDGTVDAGR